VIPKLAAGAGDEAYGLVLRELDARLDEARKVRAIDEAEQWRPVRSRACPYCGCFFLRVLLDAAKRPAGRIECFGHGESGAPCRAAWARALCGPLHQPTLDSAVRARLDHLAR